MGKPLTITRTDRSSGELRAMAAKCRDGAQVRRLLALAMVLEGAPRTDAAACNGMDRQTLRDWVHRYNEGGVDALKSRESPGRTPYLTEAQMAELRQLVVDGPDLATDKVVRWRIADLHGVVKRRFSVDVHPSTVGTWLHQLRLTRLQPRPVHPKKDPAAETAFKKRARINRPPVAVETGCAILVPRGAAEKFLVDLTPQKNVVHGLLRTCEW
jgi:transposase